MFLSIQADEIFDLKNAQASETHPAYWLAQLRKADWQYLLKFVEVMLPQKTKKQTLAEAALPHFEFTTCEGRGEVLQMWTELHKTHRVLSSSFAIRKPTGRVARRSSSTWKIMNRSAW